METQKSKRDRVRGYISAGRDITPGTYQELGQQNSLYGNDIGIRFPFSLLTTRKTIKNHMEHEKAPTGVTRGLFWHIRAESRVGPSEKTAI